MNNVLQDIPQNLDQEVLDILLQHKNVTIERIVSKGHSSPESGWYDQIQNEWVIVLKGEGILSFESEPDIHLKPGEHINIPAHKKHKVKWTKPDVETIWLAVFY